MQKPNIVLMMGESWGVHQEVERWKKAFLEKHGDLNIEEYDAEETEPTVAFQSAHVPPFLGEKRLVILKNALHKKKKPERTELFEAIQKVPDFTVFILIENEEAIEGKELAEWQSAITVKSFAPESFAEQRERLERRLRKEGRTLEPGQLQMLIERLGHDPWALDQEVNKIFIRPAELPKRIEEENVFKMSDELSERRWGAALTRLKRLSQNGEEILKIMGLITRQFRLLLEVKSAQMQEWPDAKIASDLKIPPFVVKKLKTQVHQFTLGELKKISADLHALDLRIKTGQVHNLAGETDHPYLLLEILLKQNLDKAKTAR